MAGDTAIGAGLPQQGHFNPASLHRERAARMKAAAGRRIEQARHFTGHDRMADKIRVGARHGVEQRARTRPVLGSWVRYRKGSGALGRRAAQHVEADQAGSALVPGRQPAAGPALFAVHGAADQGADGRNSGLRLWRGLRPCTAGFSLAALPVTLLCSCGAHIAEPDITLDKLPRPQSGFAEAAAAGSLEPNDVPVL